MTPHLCDIVPEARLKLLQRRGPKSECRLDGDGQPVKPIVHEHREILAAIVVSPVVRIVDRRPRQSRWSLSLKILREINHCGKEFIRQCGRKHSSVVRGGAMYSNSIDYPAAGRIHGSHHRTRRVIGNLWLALTFSFISVAAEDVVVVVERIIYA